MRHFETQHHPSRLRERQKVGQLPLEPPAFNFQNHIFVLYKRESHVQGRVRHFEPQHDPGRLRERQEVCPLPLHVVPRRARM